MIFCRYTYILVNRHTHAHRVGKKDRYKDNTEIDTTIERKKQTYTASHIDRQTDRTRQTDRQTEILSFPR